MIQDKFKFDKMELAESCLACWEAPERRAREFGVNTLSDGELLGYILQSVMRLPEAMRLSARLLTEAGSLDALLSWQEEDLRGVGGLPPKAARLLMAVGEAARRLAKGPSNESVPIRTAQDVVQHLRPLLMGLEVEKFWVFCVNRKSRLIRLVEISSGTLNSTVVHPRDVFRAAIRHNAGAIICAHNHPSGDPVPSSADVNVTRTLRDASRAMEFELIDHVIVGEPRHDPTGKGYYSFREAGII